uniref:Uncharacterized protein n=1 Tax=Arundo donax TaxID=35708 RepID=A0A0A9EHG8_ARUDO
MLPGSCRCTRASRLPHRSCLRHRLTAGAALFCFREDMRAKVAGRSEPGIEHQQDK